MPRTVIVTAKSEYSMFCRWLKSKLNENNISQAEFEDYLGLSHSAFNKRINENGSMWELMDYLKALDYFNASPDDVFK